MRDDDDDPATACSPTRALVRGLLGVRRCLRMTRLRVSLAPPLAMALFALVGCSPPAGPDALDVACSGARPASVGECVVGRFHAECGGVGGAVVLACARGACRWFAGGCVPRDHRVSVCPIEEPCCEASSTGGTWPFADDWSGGGDLRAVVEMTEDLRVIGSTPIAADAPATISVVLDPSTPARAPSAECVGTTHLRFCERAGYSPAWHRVGESLVMELHHGGPRSEVLIVEVLRGRAGLVARAFVRTSPDGAPPGAPDCESAASPSPPPEITGEITLSGFELDDPSAVHATATLRAGDGEIRFEL